MIIDSAFIFQPGEFREWFFDLPRDTWEYTANRNIKIIDNEVVVIMKLKFGDEIWVR